jgi:hypothetical protein
MAEESKLKKVARLFIPGLIGLLLGVLYSPLQLWGERKYYALEMKNELYQELGENVAILRNVLARLATDSNPFKISLNLVTPTRKPFPGASEMEFRGLTLQSLKHYQTTQELVYLRFPQRYTFEWVDGQLTALSDSKKDMAALVRIAAQILSQIDALERSSSSGLDGDLLESDARASEPTAIARPLVVANPF